MTHLTPEEDAALLAAKRAANRSYVGRAIFDDSDKTVKCLCCSYIGKDIYKLCSECFAERGYA